jgi:diadenosine tetraphosphate (Ap4A) HIT family hydrolase
MISHGGRFAGAAPEEAGAADGGSNSKMQSRSWIFEDEIFTLEQSAECSIPGYLILRLKGPETSLAQLRPETATQLGVMLQRAAQAIERAVAAERVYVLSFCEVEPRLHFHLFPRPAWLLGEYVKANGCAAEPVDGPALFAWARRQFGPGSRMPKGAPDNESVRLALREMLK